MFGRYASLRVNRHGAQTAILTFRHKRTGRKVALFGAMHVGDSEYYSLMHKWASESGCTVLYEGIGPISDEQKGMLTEAESGILEDISRLMAMVKSISRILGCAHQGDTPYPSAWTRSDMTFFELIKSISRSGSNLRIDGNFDKPELYPLVRFAFNALMIGPLCLFRGLIRSRISQTPGLSDVIVDQRNAIALSWIQTAALSRDVVSIWGAEHLPGIGRLLNREGYRLEKREWTTAYRRRPLGFADAIYALKGLAE